MGIKRAKEKGREDSLPMAFSCKVIAYVVTL